MKIFDFLKNLLKTTFLESSTPHLFGSVKRRKAKEGIASDYRSTIDQGFEASQAELGKQISSLETQNPFESAAAKSAMAQSSRKAKQTQQRFANLMGANTNPEAMVAAQQATQESVAGTAGNIAVGSEAQKTARLDALNAQKRQGRDIYSSQVAQAGQMKTAAVDEIGQGWKDFFSAMDSVANLAGAAGGVVGAI